MSKIIIGVLIAIVLLAFGPSLRLSSGFSREEEQETREVKP